jgi:hypothetical protein
MAHPSTALRDSAEAAIETLQANIRTLRELARCNDELYALCNSQPLTRCAVHGDQTQHCHVMPTTMMLTPGVVSLAFMRCGGLAGSETTAYTEGVLVSTCSRRAFRQLYTVDPGQLSRQYRAVLRNAPRRTRQRENALTLILASRRRQRLGFPRLPPELWSMIFHEFVLGE